MRYGSVCSGIEAATVAWEPLGWTPAFFSEIDPFCSSLLDQRYPGVPNYGDFTQLLDPAHPVHSQPPIDVLVGGTPCQDFSIAGLRAGVAGARGSLTLDFCRLVDVLRPRWVVWENVPGVLSSDGGRALGAFTGALAELGYGFAWRVLDAQYFGLAQRRKRVFVVGHSGGQPGRPGAVLLEPEGVRGDPPSRKQARQVATSDVGSRAACGSARPSLAITERGRGDGLSLEHQEEVAYALTNPGDGGRTNNRMVAVEEVTITQADVAGTLDSNYFKGQGSRQGGEREFVATLSPEVAGTLGGSSQSGGFRTTDLDNSGAFIACVFTGDGEVADPVSANEGRTYTHEGNVFRMHNCVGFYPTGGTHGVSATDEGMPPLKVGTGEGGNAPAVAFSLSPGRAGCGEQEKDDLFVAERHTSRTLTTNCGADPSNHQGGMLVLSSAVAFNGYQRTEGSITWPLGACDGRKVEVGVRQGFSVRRLTPRECERLQGFPDDYTLVPYRKGLSADGHRYKALGNSMAVPVMRWIGARIYLVDQLDQGE